MTSFMASDDISDPLWKHRQISGFHLGEVGFLSH